MRILFSIISVLASIVLMYKWRYRVLDVLVRIPLLRKVFVKQALSRMITTPE